MDISLADSSATQMCMQEQKEALSINVIYVIKKWQIKILPAIFFQTQLREPNACLVNALPHSGT